MKEFLAALPLLIAFAVGQAPSPPYQPSGWRPNGPSFDLPQNSDQQGTFQSLPEPRNPQRQYGVPSDDEDVSVQGLPVREQVPLFQLSPVNGRQYVGPSFNDDVRQLDANLRESQKQQETFREIARQRQLNAASNRETNLGINSPSNPQFKPRTPSYTESTTLASTPYDAASSADEKETQSPNDSKTPPRALSENGTDRKQNVVSVEVSRQRIQELPAEVLLSPLAQFNSPAKLYTLQQLSQLRTPAVFVQSPLNQLSQRQIAAAPVNGYDGLAHLSALQSILSQRQQAIGQPQDAVQNQKGFVQTPSNVLFNNNQDQLDVKNDDLLNQYSPIQQPQTVYSPQIQPVLLQNQPQIQYPQPQFQLDNQYLIPQNNVPQMNFRYSNEDEKDDSESVLNNAPIQPQFVINQPQSYQPQEVQYQQQFPIEQQPYQPQNQRDQPQDYQQNQLLLNQPQLINYQPVLNQDLSRYYQNQPFLIQQQQIGQQQAYPQGYQNQSPLQNGLNTNEQETEIDQTNSTNEDNADEETDTNSIAVATSFGTRTSPRVYNQYGVPSSRAVPQEEPTTESMDASTEDGPAIAEANAVARGGRRKNVKLRNRRLRPLFTLDKSGHLVLVDQQ